MHASIEGLQLSTKVAIETENLTVGYAGVPVASNLDISVQDGEVVALLGRNGAGKTTILNSIAGLTSLISGHVRLHGDKPQRSFHMRVRGGLAYVTEQRAIIRRLTVKENLKLSGSNHDAVYDLFPELFRLQNQRAGLLSGGEQQMLAVGKLISRKPKAFLVDELSFGLGPMVVDRLLESIRTAADMGAGVLLVEQQPAAALTIADRAYVLSGGEIRMTGSGANLLGRLSEIEEMYLEN